MRSSARGAGRRGGRWGRAGGLLAWGLVIAALTPTGACAGPAGEYREVRRTWTRHEDYTESFVLRLDARATLKTAAFRRAYADEYGRLFALTSRQHDRLLRGELDEARREYVFVVALYTVDREWNDLSPQAAIWEVRLQNGANEYLRPRVVRRLDDRNPTFRAMFPDAGDQHTLWELRFDRVRSNGEPLARPGEQLELIIAGAAGRVRLVWRAPN